MKNRPLLTQETGYNSPPKDEPIPQTCTLYHPLAGRVKRPCYFCTQICSPRHPKHADYRRMIIYGNETYKPPNAAS